MGSEQVNTTIYGEDADVLNQYVEEHDCSKAEAARHYVNQGVQAEATESVDNAPEPVPDGGVAQPTALDHQLETVTNLSGVGLIVGLLLWYGFDIPEMAGAIVMFFIIAITAGVARQLRENDRKEEEGDQ